MIEQLREKLSPDVKENESMAPHTSFKIGGPAEYYYEASSGDEVLKAVNVAKELDVPLFVFGGGSNMVVSDAGIKGLVVRVKSQGIEIEGNHVTAAAGTASGLVAMKATEAGLTGLEWMVGLPGTIGGAVRGNAGMFGGELKDTMEAALVVKDGELIMMGNEECKFEYRSSIFKREPGPIVLAATFLLEEAKDKEASKAELKENLLKKKEQQPVEFPTAGCVFMNWKPQSEEQIEQMRDWLDVDIDEQVPVSVHGTVPAAWIIDQAQLKGYNVGDISVSERHANFFINGGEGKADNIVALIAAVKMKVRNMTDGEVNLLEEVEYVGFG